jgi:hypothetical protein
VPSKPGFAKRFPVVPPGSGVRLGPTVGGTGVAVAFGSMVEVSVGVNVSVGTGVSVGVFEGGGVKVGVSVGVAVAVGVSVDVGVRVGVGVSVDVAVSGRDDGIGGRVSVMISPTDC